MSDLLSAASILAAILGMLLSIWYPAITETLDLERKNQRDDRNPAIRKIWGTIIWKSGLLAIMTIALVLIFLPDFLQITKHMVKCIDAAAGKLDCAYSAVSTAYCYVVFLLSLIGVYALVLTVSLVSKLLNFRKTP